MGEATTKGSSGRRTRGRAAAVNALVEQARSAAEKKRVADAARAEELLALIERRKSRIAEDFFEIGEALRELAEKKLYASLGFRSFEELLAKRRVIGATQAFKLIDVVRTFTVTEALGLGPERAYAIIQYTRATPAPDDPRAIVKAGRLAGRALEKLGRREIDEAGRRARARAKASGKTKSSPEERAAHAAARRWQARLRADGVKKARARARRIEKAWWIEALVPADAIERVLG